MKVLLIERDRICKYELPSKIEDSFVINYKPMGGRECVVTMEARDGSWYLKSTRR